jgi:hypothetical protein
MPRIPFESPGIIVFVLLFANCCHQYLLHFETLPALPEFDFRGMVSSAIFSLSRPCIRSFVDRALSVGHRPGTDGLVAVHGHLGGGFGNNFIDIISMIQFAIVCGIREIFVDENFLLLSQGTILMTMQGIKITVIVSSSHIPYPSEKWIESAILRLS